MGAIIVDKTKKVIGKGWNRMPKGCEDRFAMSKGDTDILKTKYPYGEVSLIIGHSYQLRLLCLI